MVLEDTLRIKHLPKELSNAEKEEFLEHFGALRTKIITSVNEKSVAYARFENKDVAKAVLFRLHQLNVLNSRLSVEYSEVDISNTAPVLKKVEDTENINKKYFKNFVCKLHSFNNTAGFHQPPPPNLKYDYPKANRATINNIAHALASVPKFYTQVLHLMNRMNLPPPFAMPEAPSQAQRPPVAVNPLKTSAPTPIEEKSKSSSESELESDGEQDKNKEIIPQKRLLSQKKAVKRPKFIKPNVATPNLGFKPTEKAEDVFEKVDVRPTHRKIELKVTSDNLEKLESSGIVEDATPIQTNEASDAETNKGPIITEEELKNNQIPLKDLGVLPVFKNYHPGAPSCRLYIKNIAKNVEITDLEYIFNKYKTIEAEKESDFSIKLMQEGRMKGQAFVTLDNLNVAQKALKETNGYILKDKPLVVVFAKGNAKK